MRDPAVLVEQDAAQHQVILLHGAEGWSGGRPDRQPPAGAQVIGLQQVQQDGERESDEGAELHPYGVRGAPSVDHCEEEPEVGVRPGADGGDGAPDV